MMIKNSGVTAMGGKIVGIKTDKRCFRLAAMFACACLVMTGHYIYTVNAAPVYEMTLVRADGAILGGDGAQNPADGAQNPADGLQNPADGAQNPAGGDITGGIALLSGSETEQANAGAAPVSPADSAIPAAIAESDDGRTASPEKGAQSVPGAGGPEALAPVRDGYQIPGGVYGQQIVSDQDRIYVYVTGAVKRPGVYALLRSSMVIDAVELAGGFTEQADSENVNMVYRLESNAMLNIKRKPYTGASGSFSGGGADAAPAGVGNASNNLNSSELYGGAIEIVYNCEDALMTGDNSSDENKGGQIGAGAIRVNINNAPLNELETLPGIGKATAEKIIEYRNRPKFLKIEDLMKVNGIKQAKYDAIKDYISCN
jgi:competence protein ComEA